MTATEIIGAHLIGTRVRVEFDDGGEPEYGTLTGVGPDAIEIEYGSGWQVWTRTYGLTGDADTPAVVAVTAVDSTDATLF